eukprot:12364036-Heterocapsa_arctica.AAC.1
MECDNVVQRRPEVGSDFFVDDSQGAAMGGYNCVKHHLADAATSWRLAIDETWSARWLLTRQL